MNRLISLIASCEFGAVTSLRRLYANEGGNIYHYDDVTIECNETSKNTMEYVKFTVGFPLSMLGIEEFNNRRLNPMTADYGLRRFAEQIEMINYEKELSKEKEKYKGQFYILHPTQKIIMRNSCYIARNHLYLSLVIRFPLVMASKRTVVAAKLSVKLIRKDFARAIRNFVAAFDLADYKKNVKVYIKQQEIRKMLPEKGLVCFIANGSILPRNRMDLPLKGAIPFQSPPEDEVEMRFADGSVLQGMGVKEGVTVITGGGYSGKSTLLDGMLHGIYDHIPRDGREYCIMQERACKIIAEDGRSVTSLDISPFISDVGNLKTKSFTTQHASGSTSQASNIMEAISFGCDALLIDEDRTATNFMIRDARMKQIIQDDPIVPFTDRVRQIYKDTGISTVLIIGGSSEYLDLADNVYIMKEYVLYNYNEKVQQTKQNFFDFFTVNDKKPIAWRLDRTLDKKCMMTMVKDDTNRIRESMSINNDEICIGAHKANIARLETVVSPQQIAAIAFMIRHLFNEHKASTCCLIEEITALHTVIKNQGFDAIYTSKFDIDFNLELPTIHDVLFSLSRMHTLIYT